MTGCVSGVGREMKKALRLFFSFEPVMGVEPATCRLQGGCSAIELHRQQTIQIYSLKRGFFQVIFLNLRLEILVETAGGGLLLSLIFTSYGL